MRVRAGRRRMELRARRLDEEKEMTWLEIVHEF